MNASRITKNGYSDLEHTTYKKQSFRSPHHQNKNQISQQPFRRNSCRCNECGQLTLFQEKQNVLVPQTYIRAHFSVKMQRKMQRRKGTRISHSAMMQQSKNAITQRKCAKTLLLNSKTQECITKCRRLQTKDDQRVSYDFFYQNELRISQGINLTKTTNFDSQALISLAMISKFPSMLESYQDIDQSKITQEQSNFKNKIKYKSMHGRKLTDTCLNFRTNKTIQQFVQQKLSSPPHTQIVLPSVSSLNQTTKILSQRSIYLLHSPKSTLIKMKTQLRQLSSEKKIKTCKK